MVQFSGQKKARVCLIINRQYHSDHSVNNDDDDGDKNEDVPNYHHDHVITIISAVSSRRPIEIGSGGTREGERAAEVRAG